MSDRILVIRLSAMGDVIHALPAVASLKRSFPNFAIDWLIHPRWTALLEGNPTVDAAIPFDRKGGVGAAVQRLRRERYRVVVDFQGLIQSAVLARAARADRVIGLHRSQARESLAALLYSTPVLTTRVHRVDSCLELAVAAGADSTGPVEFPLPHGAAEGSLPEGRFVLACPLAGWESKQWPLEHFSEIARALEQDFGIPLVVNGPPSAAAQLGQIEGARIHLSGVPGLIDATRRACAVIGVDSGPLHLAAALRKSGVAIYGPTDPASHGPYDASAYGMRVLRAPDATTSYKRREEIDPSMRAIEPRMVYEALTAALTAPATGTPAGRNRT